MQSTSGLPKTTQTHQTNTESNSLSPIESLPEEVLLHLFHTCAPSDIGSLSSTCHIFNTITNDRTIKKRLENETILQFKKQVQNFVEKPQVLCECEQSIISYSERTHFYRNNNILAYSANGSNKLELFDIREKRHIKTIDAPFEQITQYSIQDSFIYILTANHDIWKCNVMDSTTEWSSVLLSTDVQQAPYDFRVYADCIILKCLMDIQRLDLSTNKTRVLYKYESMSEANKEFFGEYLLRYGSGTHADPFIFSPKGSQAPISILYPENAVLAESDCCYPRSVTEENLLLSSNIRDKILIFDIKENKCLSVISIKSIVPMLFPSLTCMDQSLGVLFLTETDTLYIIDAYDHKLLKTHKLENEVRDIKVIGKQLYCATTKNIVLFDFSSVSLIKQDELVKAHIDPIEEPTTFCEILSSFVDRIERCVRSLF